MYYFAAFANVSSLVFLNSSLPYLLTHFLKIPQDDQGTPSVSFLVRDILVNFILANFSGDMIGNILLCNEVTLIISVEAWGLLSDVIGTLFLLIV